MMNLNVIVVGSINMDMFAIVAELPRTGETVLGDKFFSCIGGKGANQAVAIARLQCPVSLVARIGKDLFGKQMLSNLKENDIDARFVIEDSDASSGVALVNVNRNGENTVVVVPGTNQRLSGDDVLRAESVISRAKVLVAQLEIPLETVDKALSLAKRYNVKTILNPAPGNNLPEDLLQKVDILTPNETELERLVRLKISTKDDMKRACQKLLKTGVKTVILTIGREGVIVADKKGFNNYPALSVEAVDTTGAGDAFTGGLAAFLAEGLELDQAVKKAIQVAGYSVTKLGAQPSLPTRMELEEFIRIITGK